MLTPKRARIGLASKLRQTQYGRAQSYHPEQAEAEDPKCEGSPVDTDPDSSRTSVVLLWAPLRPELQGKVHRHPSLALCMNAMTEH